MDKAILRKDLWCIFMVHCTGGGACPSGNTPEQARQKAKALSEKFPKAYVVSTIPYPVRHRPVPDVTVPQSIKDQWGPEIRKLYDQS